MSNSLDPDQGRRSVGPDLDSNCLQRLSADDTGRQRVRGWGNSVFSLTADEGIQYKTEELWMLIWIQTVCKGYQQTTLVGKELEDGLDKCG